tara:strand:+ start:437 stop:784 length:348 start_codon:yes stop_codon:yes gene_type:complete
MEFPDSEAFQFLVDPFAGRIVLMIPAPMICFEDIDAFKDFISTLQEAVPKLDVTANSSIEPEVAADKSITPIDRTYAEKVIESWQNLVMENFPKKTGPNLQKTKPNDSIPETGNP